MKNWKTSLAGVVAALAGFVVFSPDTFVHYPVVVQLAKYFMVGGFAALGFASKDSTTHSTAAEVATASPDNVARVTVSSTVQTETAASSGESAK